MPSNNGTSKKNQKRKNRNNPSNRGRQGRRLANRFGPDALSFVARNEGNHSPLPQVYLTRFTASGYAYTSSGAGTGDYIWNLKLNSCRHPFANMSTGLTWGNLTPASFNPTGFASLISSTMYQSWIVYDTLLEIDVTPQSVTDSVVLTVTPSLTSSVPATVGAALSLPFTKQMTFASGRNYRLGDFPFKFRLAPHKYLGQAQFLYDNDTSGNFVGSPTLDPPAGFWLVINMETGDNAILNNPLEIRVRQTFWVKCYQLNTESMVNTFTRQQRLDARAAAALGVGGTDGKEREDDPMGFVRLAIGQS